MGASLWSDSGRFYRPSRLSLQASVPLGGSLFNCSTYAFKQTCLSAVLWLTPSVARKLRMHYAGVVYHGILRGIPGGWDYPVVHHRRGSRDSFSGGKEGENVLCRIRQCNSFRGEEKRASARNRQGGRLVLFDKISKNRVVMHTLRRQGSQPLKKEFQLSRLDPYIILIQSK